MSIGRNIKRLRESQGMSQTHLADLLGVSNKTVSSWESDTNPKTPRMGVIERLADIFSVPKSNIVDGDVPFATYRTGTFAPVRVVGTVRAGYGGVTMEHSGYEYADVPNPEDYFYLRVEGDSMSPMINDGDLALVRVQNDVESGQLAVVVINGEEGTIKKVIKQHEAMVLLPFNPACETRIFAGKELEIVRIAGLVIETKRKWG